jgi:thiol-disulfide isomerase/thioredoxin
MATRISKRIWIILAIVIIAVGAIVGIALSRNPSTPLDVTLPIITWNETSLSELEGTPAVLNFWSIRCPYCVGQLPYLENVAQQSEGELKVIAINMANSVADIQNFFGDYEPAMTIAVDKNGEAFVDYCQRYGNGGSIPFTLFIDSEGAVQYAKIGAFASETELWNALHDVLGIATPETS